MVDVVIEDTKQLESKVIQNTVVDYPAPHERTGVFRTILMTASTADVIPAWNAYNTSTRDKLLREFYKTEPMLASGVYTATARNSSFQWEIVPSDPSVKPPRNTIRAVTKMLANADRGNGWSEFMSKICVDLYTQDNGAFIELIRLQDDPSSPVINIAHLDSQRIYRTGNPEVPIIYEDRFGRWHELKWYQVRTLEEFPMPDEEAYGTQLCAVSRCLLAAQILRDIHIYKREKVSGSFTRAIHFVGGVSQGEIDDALAWAKEQNLNLGLYRYSQPVIVPGLDPGSPVNVETIDLATLPDAFDEETANKWYVAQLAMAFGVDYQEFAPLPGGNLGSSQQADILDKKTRGKGPALIMSLIEHMMNDTGILPATVRFQFKEHDLRVETDKANAAYTRGKDRAMRLESGELDPDAAIDLAVYEGDIPEHIALQVKERGLAKQRYMRNLEKNSQVSNSSTFGGMNTDNPSNG